MQRPAWWVAGLLCVGTGATACGGKVLIQHADETQVPSAAGATNTAGSAQSVGGSANGGVSSGGASGAGTGASGASGASGAESGGVSGGGELGGFGPIVSVAPPGGCDVVHLALAPDALYYTTATFGGNVMRLSLASLTLAAIARDQKNPTLIAVRGGSVYWLSAGENAIYRDSTTKAIVRSGPPMTAFTIDDPGQIIYYANGSMVTGVVLSNSFSFGAMQEVNHEVPTALAVLGNHLAMVSNPGVVDIVTLGDAQSAWCGPDHPYGDQNCARLAQNQPSLLDENIAYVGGKVYWGDGWELKTIEPLALHSTTEIVARTSAPDDPIVTFAVANGTAYTSDKTGFLQATSLIDNPSITSRSLAANGRGADSIVADASFVYWAEDCQIWRSPVQ